MQDKRTAHTMAAYILALNNPLAKANAAMMNENSPLHVILSPEMILPRRKGLKPSLMSSN